jgi:hypothetical protein
MMQKAIYPFNLCLEKELIAHCSAPSIWGTLLLKKLIFSVYIMLQKIYIYAISAAK